LDRSGLFPDATEAGCRLTGPELRVLLVVANRDYGGAERHVVDLAGELARRGHRVGCLFPEASGVADLLAPEVEALAVGGPWLPYRLTRGLRTALRVFRPDVVHLHGPRATLLGRLVLGASPRRRRPAVVSTAHGWVPRRLAMYPLYEAAYLATARLDDVTVAVSRDTAQRFGRWARRVVVVPNGIRRPASLPPYAAPLDCGLVKLGFVGRLTQEKDFPTALAAFAAARSELSGDFDLELHVYGDGPLTDSAHRLARRAGGRGVHFHGWAPPRDIPRVLAGLTALLLTSREEGLPYVALEAMAFGCPLVASAVGGLPELIEDGVTGCLVRPGDGDGVARAVRRLATQPGFAETVRRAAWERVESYSIEAMVDGTESAYRLALEWKQEET